MATNLTFHRLELRTRVGVSSYEFQAGLNVVTGDYATGKSSLFELIKFTMGSRNPDLMPDIKRHLTSASLDITIGRDRLQLTRSLGSNSISVVSRTGLNEVWTATQGRLPRAAIRLLEMLQFPVVRLARRSGPPSEPLTFWDVFKYVYLPQADVNSSVAGHADKMVDRKRRAVFEHAYGLVDSEMEDLKVQAAKFSRTRDALAKDARAVSKFMQETGTPSLDELALEESNARAALTVAEARLAQARNLGRDAFGEDQGELRGRIGRLRAAAADLEAELTALEISVEKGKALVAQLQLDEEGEIRAAQAMGSFSGLEFARCPRCLQSISDKHVPAGHCLLCGQSQDLAPADVDLEGRLGRLRAQRSEAEDLVIRDERSLHLVMRELVGLRGQLNEAASELEGQVEPDRLLPSLDMSTEAATSRELARARLRDVERDRDLWGKYDDMLNEIMDLEISISDIDVEVDRRRRRLEQNRTRIAELSAIFDEEVRELGLVGYQNAHIDPKSYLPVINGDVFDDLSVSGARKTLANVSYYLANLSMALGDQDILMPSALILDSPRTSLGDTPGDTRAGWQLYYRMHVLALASPECQLIVADNGLPEIPTNMRREFMRRTRVIELAYDQPLLRDVGYPGRDHVQTVGSS